MLLILGCVTYLVYNCDMNIIKDKLKDILSLSALNQNKDE